MNTGTIFDSALNSLAVFGAVAIAALLALSAFAALA